MLNPLSRGSHTDEQFSPSTKVSGCPAQLLVRLPHKSPSSSPTRHFFHVWLLVGERGREFGLNLKLYQNLDKKKLFLLKNLHILDFWRTIFGGNYQKGGSDKTFAQKLQIGGKLPPSFTDFLPNKVSQNGNFCVVCPEKTHV